MSLGSPRWFERGKLSVDADFDFLDVNGFVFNAVLFRRVLGLRNLTVISVTYAYYEKSL